MKLAEFAVRNYQFTLIIFVLLMALGLSSLFNMPRREDPKITIRQGLVLAFLSAALVGPEAL